MQNNNLKLKIIITVAAIISNSAIFTTCNKQSDTLAEIGEKKISGKDFMQKYQEFRLRTGISDNGQARRGFLKNYISREILIAQARRRGYQNDAEGKRETERIEMQELLNAYHRKFVTERVDVNEDELIHLYQRVNTRLKARHLYAPSYAKADSLYRELQNGKTFEELARDIFNDPRLRDSGGMLGYFSVSEMDPAFEDAAYSLAVGEISRPVKTRHGYSIIKIEDKITKPILTEFAYAQQKERLQTYLERNKMLRSSQLLVDSLRNELNVTFNDEVVQQLYRTLIKNRDDRSGIENTAEFSIPEDLLKKKVVSSDIGVWDIADVQRQARYTSQSQLNWIRSTEKLKEFIAGLVVRSYILDQAKSLGLHNTHDYKISVAENLDTYLLKRIEQSLYQEITVPEDSLLVYYSKNKDLFIKRPKINLQQIVVDDSETANTVKEMLERNHSYSDLVQKYSIFAKSESSQGISGYLTPGDLGGYADKVFALESNEWLGPLKVDTLYVFLKCIDKIPAKTMDFEEARADVEEAVKARKWIEIRKNKITEFRQNIYVKTHPEKLVTMSYN